MTLLRAFTVLLFTLLVGCQSFDYTVTRRSAIDAQISAARTETESRLKVLTDQQIGLLKQSIATHETREQAAADYLFKGSVVGSMLKTPTRPEQVMTQSINQTSTQLPSATPAAQAAALKALQTELDEAKITTEALKTQYERELGVARAEGAAKAKALEETATKLQQVDAERVMVLTKANQTEIALQAKKDEIQDKDLAAKTREAEDAKKTQAIRTKLSAIVGALALLCIAGAIWSPVFKQELGIGGVVFGLIAVGIWWVQPWHLGVAFGVAFIGVGVWLARKHHIESKAARNVYRAIQTVKDTAKDDYDRILRPQLTEWMTTYNAKGDKVPDTAAIAHVDKVLMETEAK